MKLDGWKLYCDAFRKLWPNALGVSHTVSPAALQEMVEGLMASRPEDGWTDVRATVPIKVRPMLVSGMMATDERGPMILLDSEQDPKEQVIAFWHEALHILGMTDEFLTDEYAMSLAAAAPDILRRLAHNINVPDTARVPQNGSQS